MSYILVPWHNDPFCHLEVNQYAKYILYRYFLLKDISRVRGFTRETLSAVLVERRQYCI